MKIKRNCKTCGKEFEVYPSIRKKGKGIYCSKKCFDEPREREKCICKVCKKQFFAFPSQIKIGKGIYCSKSCANKAQKTKLKVCCQFCGKPFYTYPSFKNKGRGKFCSQKCMGLSFSTMFRKENASNWQGGKRKQKCGVCGKIFYVHLSQIENGNGKYCSRKCSNKRLSEKRQGYKNPAWKGGISFEPYCHKFNEEFKQYIRAKFGNVCFLCGKTEEENGQKLSVHHVNYDKGCGCAETEEDKSADDNTCQFVPLCRSCNSRVNKNRDLWERRIKNEMKNKLNGWYI